jgi:lysophospholipase L1-like esterase
MKTGGSGKQRRLPMKPVPFPIAALAAVILLVYGALGGGEYLQAQSAPSGHAQYVAMGSSFGAGPGVGTRAPGSPAPCIRSADNYAHLFARMRGLELTDVTCSGATTQSLLYGRRHLLAPQLDAVKPETKLVTITIGGNDVSFIGNLFAWSCENDRQRIVPAWRPSVCNVTPPQKVEEGFSGLEGNLRKTVDGIHHRSPNAMVVFVDYVTILPSKGSCRDRLPLTGEELDRGRAVAARLAALTARVAQETGSGLLKASELTQKHNLCSADPWIFGFRFPRTRLSYGPVAYHPTAKAMHAIAEKLDQMLPSSL